MAATPTTEELARWYQEWSEGIRTKSQIEREELNDPSSHGKTITALWRNRLGIETEDTHPLVIENDRLRGLLDSNDIEY